MERYIYLTVSQYDELPKESKCGRYSCYGIEYNDGFIINADVLDNENYSFANGTLCGYPIVEI